MGAEKNLNFALAYPYSSAPHFSATVSTWWAGPSLLVTIFDVWGFLALYPHRSLISPLLGVLFPQGSVSDCSSWRLNTQFNRWSRSKVFIG